MRKTAPRLIPLLGLLLMGCTVENVRQGMYEGLRTRSELQSSPPERFGRPEAPNYPEYERLRKEESH